MYNRTRCMFDTQWPNLEIFEHPKNTKHFLHIPFNIRKQLAWISYVFYKTNVACEKRNVINTPVAAFINSVFVASYFIVEHSYLTGQEHRLPLDKNRSLAVYSSWGLRMSYWNNEWQLPRSTVPASLEHVDAIFMCFSFPMKKTPNILQSSNSLMF